MRDADGGVGRIDGLASRPSRAVDVDLELVWIDLDLDLLRLGHHRDGRRGRVDPARAFGLGHPLDAVRPALPLEHGVRAVTLDREGRLLVAAAVRRARLELLDLEAASLGVTAQHPVDLAGPERSLVAADPLPHLDDHVLAIGGIRRDEGETQLLLQAARALLELGDQLAQVRVLARRRKVVPRCVPLLREVVRPLELLEAPADVRRFAVVVVHGRIGQPFLRLRVGAFELLD